MFPPRANGRVAAWVASSRNAARAKAKEAFADEGGQTQMVAGKLVKKLSEAISSNLKGKVASTAPVEVSFVAKPK